MIQNFVYQQQNEWARSMTTTNNLNPFIVVYRSTKLLKNWVVTHPHFLARPYKQDPTQAEKDKANGIYDRDTADGVTNETKEQKFAHLLITLHSLVY